jgi:hypothetical protein
MFFSFDLREGNAREETWFLPIRQFQGSTRFHTHRYTASRALRRNDPREPTNDQEAKTIQAARQAAGA